MHIGISAIRFTGIVATIGAYAVGFTLIALLAISAARLMDESVRINATGSVVAADLPAAN